MKSANLSPGKSSTTSVVTNRDRKALCVPSTQTTNDFARTRSPAADDPAMQQPGESSEHNLQSGSEMTSVPSAFTRECQEARVPIGSGQCFRTLCAMRKSQPEGKSCWIRCTGLTSNSASPNRSFIHHQCGCRIASLTRSRGPHEPVGPAPISAPCPCKMNSQLRCESGRE